MKYYRKVLANLIKDNALMWQHRTAGAINCAELTGAEVGVATAKTSEFLLNRFPNLKLLAIDSWSPPVEHSSYAGTRDRFAMSSRETCNARREKAISRLQRFIDQDRAMVIDNDSVLAAHDLPDKSLDFVFIDGDHSYEGCLADMRAYWPKVKPGGLFCGHDCIDPVPGSDLDERGRGVHKACKEFFEEHGGMFMVSINCSIWHRWKPEGSWNVS